MNMSLSFDWYVLLGRIVKILHNIFFSLLKKKTEFENNSISGFLLDLLVALKPR